MKSKTISALLALLVVIGLAAILILRLPANPSSDNIHDEKPDLFVDIASYPNFESRIEGTRVAAILRSHKIDSVQCGSVGIDIAVAASQATEAQRLIALAIVTEHLRITLIDFSLKDHRYIELTPEAVLGLQRNH